MQSILKEYILLTIFFPYEDDTFRFKQKVNTITWIYANCV